jgi:hypothetical protein
VTRAELPRLQTALPWRTRLRLRMTRAADDAAYWLVCHDHCTAARRLYKLCGLW